VEGASLLGCWFQRRHVQGRKLTGFSIPDFVSRHLPPIVTSQIIEMDCIDCVNLCRINPSGSSSASHSQTRLCTLLHSASTPLVCASSVVANVRAYLFHDFDGTKPSLENTTYRDRERKSKRENACVQASKAGAEYLCYLKGRWASREKKN
jgi:hypothetical protein